MDTVQDHDMDVTLHVTPQPPPPTMSQQSSAHNTTPLTLKTAAAAAVAAASRSLTDQQYRDLSNTIFSVGIPLLLILGSFGNVMTIVVMKRLSKRLGYRLGDFSMYVYFPCLAVCDQTVLTVGLLRKWVKSILFYDVRSSSVLACKLHKFLIYAGSRASSWILVAVTSQRVLTVLWPLRQRQKSTKWRAIVAVGVILAACSVVDSGILVLYTLKDVGKGKVKCKSVPSGPGLAYYADMVYPIIRIVSGSLLPLVILIVNNIILVYKTRQSAKALKLHHGRHSKECTDAKRSNSFTLTLIVTSVSFFVLTLPITIDFFIKHGKFRGVLQVVDTMLDLVSYSHNTFNFYLYVLAGRTFRHAVIQQLCGKLAPRSLTSGPSRRPESGDLTTKSSQRS